MQALYSLEVSGNSISDIEDSFIKQQNPSRFEPEYFLKLLHEVPKNIAVIQESLQKHMVDKKVCELDPIELAILRISAYELIFCSDEIPYKVSINEAIELAKMFGACESHSFVNGVLDSMSKSLNAHELAESVE